MLKRVYLNFSNLLRMLTSHFAGVTSHISVAYRRCTLYTQGMQCAPSGVPAY